MLDWSAASDDVSTPAQIDYLVYRATASHAQNFATPDYTVSADIHFVADDLAPQTAYYFVVRARDAAGNVDSNTVEANATTSVPMFAEDVMRIFVPQCAGVCHAQPKPDGDLDLGDAGVGYAGLVNVASEQCTTMVLVAPGSPSQSYLLQKLAGQGSCFIGDPMPRFPPFLDANQTSVVTSWISRGAPND
jgi:hypothetical protein